MKRTPIHTSRLVFRNLAIIVAAKEGLGRRHFQIRTMLAVPCGAALGGYA